MPKVLCRLMEQYDSPHYFVLDQVDDDKWKLTWWSQWHLVHGKSEVQWDNNSTHLASTWSMAWNRHASLPLSSGAWQIGLQTTIVNLSKNLTTDNYSDKRWPDFVEAKLFTIRELAERSGCAPNPHCQHRARQVLATHWNREQILSVLGAHLEIVIDEDDDDDIDDYLEDLSELN